jgi:aldehyde dehydrogenase (NAD+)
MDARARNGGHRVGGAFSQRLYIEPTVFADVDPDSEHGTARGFRTGTRNYNRSLNRVDEAIKIANDSKYGLSSYIRTNTMKRARSESPRQLNAGEVMIKRNPRIYTCESSLWWLGHERFRNGRWTVGY